jgi:nucleotide-binding universal stress UspA family protein
MSQVLCAVDGSVASAEAVRQAVAYCRDHGRTLGLVGVVRETWRCPQPAYGERVRSFNDVQYGLVRAAAAAREAGLAPTITIAAGDPARETLAEAAKVGAEEAFVPRSTSGLVALLTGRPAADVERVAVPAPGAERIARRVAA